MNAGDSDEERSEPPGEAPKPNLPIERSRFGGTDRRPERNVDAPVSRSDLSKGPEELLEHRPAHINWRVLLISSVVILAFSIWAMLVPDGAQATMFSVVTWIATNLGW